MAIKKFEMNSMNHRLYFCFSDECDYNWSLTNPLSAAILEMKPAEALGVLGLSGSSKSTE